MSCQGYLCPVLIAGFLNTGDRYASPPMVGYKAMQFSRCGATLGDLTEILFAHDMFASPFGCLHCCPWFQSPTSAPPQRPD
jgi:hypothetical protein